jgi:hypothetical protein
MVRLLHEELPSRLDNFCGYRYQAGGSWVNWAFATTLVGLYPCKGECPDGKVPIAADDTGCWSGTSYFCCDNPAGNTVCATP